MLTKPIASRSCQRIAVVKEDDLYGMQIQIEDLAITKDSPDKPALHLQIGKWLVGKTPARTG